MSKHAGFGGHEPAKSSTAGLIIKTILQGIRQYHWHSTIMESQCLLFSDNANDAESLRNLRILTIPALRMDGGLSRSHIQKSHRLSQAAQKFIAHEADEEEKDSDRWSAQLPTVMHLQGLSAKERLAATFNNMASRFKGNPPISPEDRLDLMHRAPQSRIYLMHVQRATTEHIAEHLCRKGFPITISALLTSQLYVVADSPKMVAQSLPGLFYFAMKEYTHIIEEEHEVVKHAKGATWPKSLGNY
ncbi:hypothetical protein EV424DRAFT_1349352 [Suillus variegatus]|nr:hypothetical protein EV424DRAFT_1349352 [Suillus variegatus]